VNTAVRDKVVLRRRQLSCNRSGISNLHLPVKLPTIATDNFSTVVPSQFDGEGGFPGGSGAAKSD
jgi:hypothetical protein